jgi:hypothetical protein
MVERVHALTTAWMLSKFTYSELLRPLLARFAADVSRQV